MIEEPFIEEERQRLRALVLAAVPHDHGDDGLTALLSKLSGVDTVLVAQRAYPSRSAGQTRSDILSDDAA